MKSLIKALGIAAVLAVPVASFAQSTQPATRAEVRADLVQTEQAGYYPTRMNPQTAVQDMQAAQARVAERNAAYGASTNGSSQAGAVKN